MKTQTTQQTKFFRCSLLVLTFLLLAACGTSKSNPTTSTITGLGVTKPMANCNKWKDSNISLNSGIVADQSGQLSGDFIKIKFNFLSTTMTASNNVLRFYKWRVVNGTSQLDNTPLTFASYDLNTGQTVSSNVTSTNISNVNGQYGFYIQLNDPNFQFQVLKVVIYDNAGQIVGQLNSLIPGFYANPLDYQYNSDGTARASILLNLHALYGTNVAGWSTAQFQQSFDQYCF